MKENLKSKYIITFMISAKSCLKNFPKIMQYYSQHTFLKFYNMDIQKTKGYFQIIKNLLCFTYKETANLKHRLGRMLSFKKKSLCMWRKVLNMNITTERHLH